MIIPENLQLLIEDSINKIYKKLNKIYKKQGYEEYYNIVQEELLELLVELQKSKRKKRGFDVNKVSEELADVFISIDILLLIHPELKEVILKRIKEKIDRSNYRLEHDIKNL